MLNIFQIYGQKELVVMSEIKCLVCNGHNFKSGNYEIDVDVDIYSHAYNDVKTRSSSWSHDVNHIDVDVNVDVDTTIHNEVSSKGEIRLRLIPEHKKTYGTYIDNIYKYICEDCGYIMSFIKEIQVETREQERKRKQKESGYDWTDFGK
jgi:hypothetical protein